MRMKTCHQWAKLSFNFTFWLLFLSVFSMLTGCSTQTFYYGKVYYMDPEQVLIAEEKAGSGNAEAAMELYRHYNFGLINRDETQAEYWLQIAAKNGDQVAIKNLKAIVKRKNLQ